MRQMPLCKKCNKKHWNFQGCPSDYQRHTGADIKPRISAPVYSNTIRKGRWIITL